MSLLSVKMSAMRVLRILMLINGSTDRDIHDVVLGHCGKRIPDTVYCNAIYDGFLCWPPTAAGETSYQHCPDIRLSDATKFAYRRCGADGFWVGRHLNDTTPNGWTNYTPCFPALVQNLFYKVYDNEGDAQVIFKTAQNTRYLELGLYSISLVAILATIYIYSAFPVLNNRRTRIHKNLFTAFLFETIIRIIIYSDQLIIRDIQQLEENKKRGIENMPYLCEGTYVTLEYFRLVVYTWMFIEGLYLQTVVSDRTLRKEIPFKYYWMLGWIAPAVIVATWAAVAGHYYSGDKVKICWYGYNYLPSYYIVQGPIFAIIGINLIFETSIMYVIIMKLRQTNDSELEKIKKGVRAALILTPLLGIGNIFNLFEYPLDGSATGFAIWCYTTHFFRASQGSFIAVIYCFTNAEVIRELKKHYERCSCRKGYERRRRESLQCGVPDLPI